MDIDRPVREHAGQAEFGLRVRWGVSMKKMEGSNRTEALNKNVKHS